MATVRFSTRALADLEDIFEFMAKHDPFAARRAGEQIVTGARTLADHPLIGRPVKHGLRELIISRGRTGYVALYRFLPQGNFVDVLALRHQRDAGFD